MSHLAKIEGINTSTAEKLEKGGFEDAEAVAAASVRQLRTVLEMDEETIEQVINNARGKALDGSGFKTATEVQPSADFSNVDAPEEVYGWTRFIQSQSRVGWESPANYRIIVSGHHCRIWGSLPNENHEVPHTITEEQTLRTRMESPEEAVEWVKNWMVMRAISPDSNLSEYYGISDKVAEHLQIVYAVNDGADLYQFMLEDEETLEQIIGPQNFDQLQQEIIAEYGGGQ